MEDRLRNSSSRQMSVYESPTSALSRRHREHRPRTESYSRVVMPDEDPERQCRRCRSEHGEWRLVYDRFGDPMGIFLWNDDPETRWL